MCMAVRSSPVVVGVVYFYFFICFAKHIIVGRLFRNIHPLLAWLVLGSPTSNPDRSARGKRLLRDAASRLEAGSKKRVAAKDS